MNSEQIRTRLLELCSEMQSMKGLNNLDEAVSERMAEQMRMQNSGYRNATNDHVALILTFIQKEIDNG